MALFFCSCRSFFFFLNLPFFTLEYLSTFSPFYLFSSRSAHLHALFCTCPFVFYPPPPLPGPLPLCPSGGSGGDSAGRGEGSDVQGVFAVGVCGQSPDAAGGPVRSPERGPRRFCPGSGCHHTAPAFHEVRTLVARALPYTPPTGTLPLLAQLLLFIFYLSVLLNFLLSLGSCQIILHNRIAVSDTLLGSCSFWSTQLCSNQPSAHCIPEMCVILQMNHNPARVNLSVMSLHIKTATASQWRENNLLLCQEFFLEPSFHMCLCLVSTGQRSSLTSLVPRVPQVYSGGPFLFLPSGGLLPSSGRRQGGVVWFPSVCPPGHVEHDAQHRR